MGIMELEEAKKKKEEFLNKYIMAESDYTREALLEEIDIIKKKFPELWNDE